jgi:hypothetical protein
LDESVNKDGEWALNRLSDAHDIHVPLCPALSGELNDANYKYRHEMTRQCMLTSGAFLIENPAKADDGAAMNSAAVGSVFFMVVTWIGCSEQINLTTVSSHNRHTAELVFSIGFRTRISRAT